MKLRPVNLLEVILGVLFISSHFLRAHIPYAGLFTAFSGMILAFLYFNIGFNTLKSKGISPGNAVAYGLIFGVTVISLIFNYQRWPFARAYLITSLSIFLVAAALRILAVYIFKSKQLLAYNNSVAVRYVILLVLMLLVYFRI